MLKLISLAFFTVARSSIISEHDLNICKASAAYTDHLFKTWMRQHGYDFAQTDEYELRHGIFLENLRKIDAHNADEKQTFTMKMNQFGHLTAEEWRSMYTGGIVQDRPKNRMLRSMFVSDNDIVRVKKLPAEVDWAAAGAVTEVKNQGTCGSCWTFSAVGAIEGAVVINGGPLQDLSMQQIVDCDSGGNGCNGGLMDQAFQWEQANDGLCSLKDYPYTSGVSGATGTECLSEKCRVIPGTQVQSYTDVLSTDHALMSALAKQPVAIAIEADQQTFQFYSSGVLTSDCGSNLDHGVLAVGYGTSEDGIDYYKIKNSWGTSWGEDGYIRLERGGDQEKGQCGLLSSPSYPNMA